MSSVQKERFTDILCTVSSVRYLMSNLSMSDPLPFVQSPATRVAVEGEVFCNPVLEWAIFRIIKIPNSKSALLGEIFLSSN